MFFYCYMLNGRLKLGCGLLTAKIGIAIEWQWWAVAVPRAAYSPDGL